MTCQMWDIRKGTSYLVLKMVQARPLVHPDSLARLISALTVFGKGFHQLAVCGADGGRAPETKRGAARHGAEVHSRSYGSCDNL